MRSPSQKDAVRSRVTGERRSLDPSSWAAEDAARTRHLLEALDREPGTVAMYASRPGEPGTTAAITLLHGRGWQVVLPLVTGTPGWAVFRGWESMHPGWDGIPEPTGPPVAGNPLALVDVVVVPCLAVARDGARLGTGGGWYDRILPARRKGVPVWALARTDEVVEGLPSEPHDVLVDAVITPDGFLRCHRPGPRPIG